MVTRYVIDGSNLAYDGLSGGEPSFRQLMEGVEALRQYAPDALSTVCVDANLRNVLSAEDRQLHARAERDRQIYIAPAGTVGGGDAWVMAVANVARSKGEEVVVVSNDSTPEQHASNQWLLDSGSLIGGRRRDRPTSGIWSATPLRTVEVEDPVVSSQLDTPDGEAPSETETLLGIDGLGTRGQQFDPSALPRAGAIVEATVTGHPNKDYAIFVLAENKYNGRVVNTEFAPEDAGKLASEVYAVDDIVFAKVISVQSDGNLRLSIRQALEAPPEEVLDSHLETYGHQLRFDDADRPVIPGYSAEADNWLPGHETEREAWQASYDAAYDKWYRHTEWLEQRTSVDKAEPAVPATRCDERHDGSLAAGAVRELGDVRTQSGEYEIMEPAEEVSRAADGQD